MKRTVLIVALFLCLLCAGCGGSSTPGPSSNTDANPSPTTTNPGNTSPLPSGTPTVLHVTRSDLSTTNNLGPLNKMVTDTQTVQNIYRAAVALPPLSTGQEMNQACLNDLAVVYHLNFLTGTTPLTQMNLDPGKCRILYLSKTDLRQVSDAFLTLVKQAIQVPSLTNP